MAERFVAADASPLIGLAAAGAFDLLRRLFGQITVTTAVRDEVLAGRNLPGAREVAEAIEDGWLKVVEVFPETEELADLDEGEASTLALARKHTAGPCLVLMDEPFGRAHARAHGLAVTGLVGVLLEAKRAEFIPDVRTLLERLENSDFRLSKEVILNVLQQAGEA